MKRMLINATQPEEVRVAMVDGQRLYDLDIEVPSKEQRKSNIYKGRISRVEPSLEACFVDYGADRHGFLPLREIAPSYRNTESQPGERQHIKDLIKEGQEIIFQVEKEERGTKGAALTTFVSLAGRYLVLKPNDPRGGGISRRIEGEERDTLRQLLSQMNIPKGMGVIVRTAGVGRTLEQLQWDLDYLCRVWDSIQQAAQARPAPFLIYQESNVIIRALRDHFTADIGEILVDDTRVYEEARGFIEMVMPQHLKHLKLHQDKVPLFTRFQIESQIDEAYKREVSLPSGGGLYIDTTEALISIDINSAKATQGSDIEETAFNTNLEAADEIARQLRLRDIGGLIVVDFIDMGSNRHEREVEKRLNEALLLDRARIQTGRISRFGLLEMSRQRLRPSLGEAVMERCPRCRGEGVIRSVESLAVSVIRLLMEEAVKDRTARVVAEVPIDVASYLLNEKRALLTEIESKTGTKALIVPNTNLDVPDFKIERIRDDHAAQSGRPSYELASQPPPPDIPTSSGATAELPAVSALTPSAPPPRASKSTQDSQPGFLKRLFQVFFGLQETDNETGGSDTSRRRGASTQNRRRQTQRSRSDSNRSGNNQRRHRNQRSSRDRSRTATESQSGRRTQSNKSTSPKKTSAPHKNGHSETKSANGQQATATQKGTKNQHNHRDSENASESPNRPRTRRGRRGGRRRRRTSADSPSHSDSAKATGNQSNEVKPNPESAKAAKSSAPKAENPMVTESAPGLYTTSSPRNQSEANGPNLSPPASRPNENQPDNAPLPSTSTPADTEKNSPELPQLAALFEQNQSDRHDNKE